MGSALQREQDKSFDAEQSLLHIDTNGNVCVDHKRTAELRKQFKTGLTAKEVSVVVDLFESVAQATPQLQQLDRDRKEGTRSYMGSEDDTAALARVQECLSATFAVDEGEGRGNQQLLSNCLAALVALRPEFSEVVDLAADMDTEIR